MKPLLAVLVLGSFLVNTSLHAASIQNGDFATCDYSAWNTESDFGTPEPGDFTITGDAPNCSANMAIDNLDSLASVNFLYQELDLSAASGSELYLNVDFSLDTELTDAAPFDAAYYSLALTDGLGNIVDQNMAFGSIFEGDILGPETTQASVLLDNSFNNAVGWSIEFQILSSFRDFNGLLPSSITINSVSIDEVVNEVSAPASMSIALIGMLFVAFTRAKKSA